MQSTLASGPQQTSLWSLIEYISCLWIIYLSQATSRSQPAPLRLAAHAFDVVRTARMRVTGYVVRYAARARHRVLHTSTWASLRARKGAPPRAGDPLGCLGHAVSLPDSQVAVRFAGAGGDGGVFRACRSRWGGLRRRRGARSRALGWRGERWRRALLALGHDVLQGNPAYARTSGTASDLDVALVSPPRAPGVLRQDRPTLCQ